MVHALDSQEIVMQCSKQTGRRTANERTVHSLFISGVVVL